MIAEAEPFPKRCRFADNCPYYLQEAYLCDVEPGPACWAWREFRQQELKKP